MQVDDGGHVGTARIGRQVQRQLRGRPGTLRRAGAVGQVDAHEGGPVEPVQPRAGRGHPALVEAGYPGRQIAAGAHDKARADHVAPHMSELVARIPVDVVHARPSTVTGVEGRNRVVRAASRPERWVSAAPSWWRAYAAA